MVYYTTDHPNLWVGCPVFRKWPIPISSHFNSQTWQRLWVTSWTLDKIPQGSGPGCLKLLISISVSVFTEKLSGSILGTSFLVLQKWPWPILTEHPKPISALGHSRITEFETQIDDEFPRVTRPGELTVCELENGHRKRNRGFTQLENGDFP